MNNHRFLELYDFEQPRNEKFSLTFLINQIVHSYIFSPKFDVNRDAAIKSIEHKDELTLEEAMKAIDSVNIELTAILFNSDDKRNDFIYEIGIKDVIALFRTAGNCNVTSSSRKFNEKKKDYDVSQSDEIIPIPDDILKIIEESEENVKLQPTVCL